jgi:hypothetical protein
MEPTTTFDELLNAAALSDTDFLAVSQPGVYNPITQENGDTRRLTVKKLMEYILGETQADELASKVEDLSQAINGIHINPYGSTLPPGIVLPGFINDEWLPMFRLLKLEGQTIDISPESPYYILGQVIYIGDADNDKPEFDGLYKVNNNGQRDIKGTKMVLPTGQGMFLRGAGANPRHFPSIGTPYDGNSTGSFNRDTVSDHGHAFYAAATTANIERFDSAGKVPFNGGSNNNLAAKDIVRGVIIDGASGGSYETAPAWLASVFLITY